MARHRLILAIARAASACTVPLRSDSRARAAYPVFFDAQYAYRILFSERLTEFPWQDGELVELQGTLVCHSGPATAQAGDAAQATWTASLYPAVTILSLETLRVKLRGVRTQELRSSSTGPSTTMTCCSPFPIAWRQRSCSRWRAQATRRRCA